MRATDVQRRKIHAIFGDFARAFPGTTAAQFKIILVMYFPAFLAEANGEHIPEIFDRESTKYMSSYRMAELITCCLWLADMLGVAFSHDD